MTLAVSVAITSRGVMSFMGSSPIKCLGFEVETAAETQVRRFVPPII